MTVLYVSLLIGGVIALPLLGLMSFLYLLTEVAKEEQRSPDRYDLF
jgi:hypothetical protein